MRARTVNYFFGSMRSRQIVFAYAIANGLTTVLQLAIITLQNRPWPTDATGLSIVVEAYIETLYPLYIGGITEWNLWMIGINVLLSVGILGWWTAKYAMSY
jgi:hypothetical protein